MKIAIVGCGMIADAHVNEIRKIENTEIIAVCDKEKLMALQLAERFDIPNYFTDFEHLINKCRPDVVHILTPPATHFHLGIMAMEGGCHVLMEKPFAVNVNQTIELIDKSISLNKKIIVNHFHNFSPPSMRLKDFVHRGYIGEILHIDGYYSYNTNSPVAIALIQDTHSWLHQLPGKLLQNNLDHLIGKFVEFIPDAKPVVWACAKQIGENVRKTFQSNIYDELRVMISGETVSVYATFSSNINPFQHTMALYGTKNTVFIDYESRNVILTPSSSLPGPFGKMSTPFKIGKSYIKEGINNLINFLKSDYHFYAGTNYLLRSFYNCIRNNTEPPIAYSNIIKTSFIMDEVFNQISNDVQLKVAV